MNVIETPSCAAVADHRTRTMNTSRGGEPADAGAPRQGDARFSVRVAHALRHAGDAGTPLLVWGAPELVQAAGLDPLSPGIRVWGSSPWATADEPAPAAGEAWRQVLVLAECPPTGVQAQQQLFRRLSDRRAERVTIVALPGAQTAGAIRHAMEAQAFALGFRKSPHYYQAVDYEGLHQEQGPVVMALERVPDSALLAYPLRALSAERDLHMDMLREVGERSDGHVIRYQLAAALIRPGDHVLDSACGLGYGSYLLARSSACASVLGVDGSDYAVRYAQMNFGALDSRLGFDKAWLPQDLGALQDRRFDVIVSFETLEHIADPEGLLAEFDRLLRPGGRVIVSVPNDWSDETGEDPNPHHLHVYTLDKLRRQFGRHFEPGALHQQIASGCKARRNGNQWTSMPRALQPVPLATDSPPDSEWWILSGTKPAAAATDLGAQPAPNGGPACDAEPSPLARGLVLAMNCTPADADPAVPAFWRELNARLTSRGMQLVVVSTTPMEGSELQVLEIPYELTGFPDRFPVPVEAGPAVPDSLVEDVARWYGCDPGRAAQAWSQARSFFEDLLQTLRPAAVLGWQSANPVTRVLRQCAREADVPFWAGERGWLRNTLMFDTLENNALGEANLSLGLATLRERHVPAEATLRRLSERASSAADLGRYPGDPRISGQDLRSRLGIPAADTVVAFFSHGEPGFGSWQSGPLAQLHDMPAGVLQARLDAVSDELVARGCWLLVQEHPFNRANGRTLRLRESSRVVSVAENVSSVVDAADFCLFTQATLQFDLAFLDKPFGLLARSPLYRAGTPPLYGDHAGAAAFLDALMEARAWPSRSSQLRHDIAFLYETQLLDIDAESLESSADRWAEHLGQLVRPVDSGFDERVGRFLAKWSDAG